MKIFGIIVWNRTSDGDWYDNLCRDEFFMDENDAIQRVEELNSKTDPWTRYKTEVIQVK